MQYMAEIRRMSEGIRDAVRGGQMTAQEGAEAAYSLRKAIREEFRRNKCS
jgi:hypothetical protein